MPTASFTTALRDLAVWLESRQRRRAHLGEQVKDPKLVCGLVHLLQRSLRANHAR